MNGIRSIYEEIINILALFEMRVDVTRQVMQRTYIVTMTRVRVTIVSVAKQ